MKRPGLGSTLLAGADSVGVNPEVRWGFSQAGLVMADTAQGSRVTSHLYDRYGRDSIVTDVNGTWILRYDGTRGILDTLRTHSVTPCDGHRTRCGGQSGPYVANGPGVAFSVVATFDTTLRMSALTNTQTYSPGSWAINDDEPYVELTPTWTEKHGSGGTPIVMSDSLGHDGWERVLAAIYRKDGTTVVRDSFMYDREGNISLAGESRTYSRATRRLTARGLHAYAYDRAGNLVLDSASGAVLEVRL